MFGLDSIAKSVRPRSDGDAEKASRFLEDASVDDETAHCFEYGCHVGHAFRLQRFLASPCIARDGPVEWAQSMGKVVITYDLPSDLDVQGLTVEMNRWQLKVSTPSLDGKRQPIPELTRDLWHTVRSLHSFWSVDGEEPGRALVVVLTKQDHASWKELWKPDPIGRVIFRRSPFLQSSAQYATSGDDRWTTLPRDAPTIGSRAEPNVEKPFRCFPKKLCLGAHNEELESPRSAAIYVLFDTFHLQYLHGFLPLEDALMAEIGARIVRLWLKFELESGGYVLLFEAELESECLLELSTWAMTWRQSRQPVGDFPALRLSIVLREDARQERIVRRARYASELGGPDEVRALATALDA